MARPCTVCLLWVRPGSPAPEGYSPTGAVSRWQDTGAVRAELWQKADPFDDVGASGEQAALGEPVAVPDADRFLAASGRDITTAQERNT